MVTTQHRPTPKLLLNLSLGAIASLIALGLLALIWGNLSAERQEIEIEKEKAEFVKQFPSQSKNASAIALQSLAARFGIKIDNSVPGRQPIAIPPNEQQAFSKIEKTLDDYLDTQAAKTSDRFDAPPPKLLGYLQVRAQRLTLLRNHLRYYQTPRWETNLSWIESGDANHPLPGFFGLVRLQKLLLVDAIAQHRQGNQSQVLANLEASWQLAESVQNRPELIAQLANLMLVRNQLGVMRHLNNLPPQWQKRLSQHHYRSSFLTALEGESFFHYTLIQQLQPAKFTKIDEVLGTNYEQEYSGLKWSGVVGRNYLRHLGMSSYQAVRTIRTQLPSTNLCTFQPTALSSEQTKGELEALGDPISVWSALQKAAQLELEIELTQKILQAKEIATKDGKLPRSLPILESSVCQGFNWVYQPASDGTASIGLAQTPHWKSRGLPLHYTLSSKVF